MMQEIQESKVELRQNRQNMYLELEFPKKMTTNLESGHPKNLETDLSRQRISQKLGQLTG